MRHWRSSGPPRRSRRWWSTASHERRRRSTGTCSRTDAYLEDPAIRRLDERLTPRDAGRDTGRMDSLVTAGVGAGCAALGSLVTGYVLKRVDRMATMRDAGRLEVTRKQHLDRYEAVKSLSGHLANLKHCVDHVCRDESADSRHAYREKGEKLRVARSVGRLAPRSTALALTSCQRSTRSQTRHKRSSACVARTTWPEPRLLPQCGTIGYMKSTT
jgi:hypothetical protein